MLLLASLVCRPRAIEWQAVAAPPACASDAAHQRCAQQ